VYNGIDRLLNAYVNTKKARSVTKTLMDSVLLYNGQGDIDDLEPNQNKFVGVRLRPKKLERHLVTILNKIGHQFSDSFDDLEIKLYNASNQNVIATYTVDQSDNSFGWTAVTTGNELRYADLHDAGSDWFIGYKQSDLEALGAQAINRALYWDNTTAITNDVWKAYYKQYSKFLDIQGFSVLESKMVNDTMFSVNDYNLEPTKSFGLNLELTIINDLTQFFIDQADMLGNAVKFNTAMVLMEQMASNTRGSNQIANQVRSLAEKQLYHHKDAYGTLYDMCKAENDNVSLDFSGLDNSSMPTDNTKTIKIKRGSV